MCLVIHRMLRLSALLLVLAGCGAGNPLKSYRELEGQLYSRLDASHCVLRLTMQGEHGCSSASVASDAPIVVANSTQELSRTSIALVPHARLSSFLQSALVDSSRLAGLLVDTSSDRPDAFSPAPLDPHIASASLPILPRWNPDGSGFIFQRFHFPIALLDTRSSYRARSAAQFERPALDSAVGMLPGGARMRSEMHASNTSKSCLEDQQNCLPLGGYSVLAAPADASDSGAEVLVLSRMDANSLFLGASVGARYNIASLAASLAIAQLLVPSEGERPFPVAFAALSGEALGLIGSRRLLQEAKAQSSGLEPLQPSKLKAVLELGSLGGGNGTHFVHSDSSIQKNGSLSASLSSAKNSAMASASGFPATTSLHAFADGTSEYEDIEKVSLSDSDEQLANQYLWSYLDDGNNSISVNRVADAVQVAAEGLRAFLGRSQPSQPERQKSKDTIRMVFDCFLSTDQSNDDCELATELLGKGTFKRQRANEVNALTDIDSGKPHAAGGVSSVAKLIFNAFGNATAQQIPQGVGGDASADTGANSSDALMYFGQGLSHVAYVPALSPRLESKGNSKWEVKPANQSSELQQNDPLWTESFWPPEVPSLSIFKRTNRQLDLTVLVTGLIVSSAAAALVLADVHMKSSRG